MLFSIFSFYVASVLLGNGLCQEMRSTWPPIYNPGEECLPYDGSKVPDCRDFVDPVSKEPYYHPHSYNCSRFWECGPTYETCLFQCASCQTSLGENPLCKGQYALSFDFNLQYPIGPVCNWPDTIDCANDEVPCDCLPWQSCINQVCSPQCTEDSHCPEGYHCDDCNWCVSDNETSPTGTPITSPTTPPTSPPTDPATPPATSPITSPATSPITSPTTTTDVPMSTATDAGCDNDDMNCKHELCDEPWNWPYTTCEYCDGRLCLPGCPDNALCPPLYPICGHYHGEPHRCGCDTDADCAFLGDYKCDTLNHVCVMEGVSGLINITVITETCDGCPNSLGHTEEGGIQVTLENRGHSCTTEGLDNLELIDYSTGHSAFFDGEPDSENEDGLGGCKYADLKVGLSGGHVTWTGSGTWTAAAQIPLCINFFGDSKPTCCCDLEDRTLENGDSSNLTGCQCCGQPPCF